MKMQLIAERNMDIIRDAYKFMLKELDLQSYDKNMTVNVAKDDQLERNCYGKCICTYNNSDLSPKHVAVLVKEIPTVYGIIECLAHEMIHAKQHWDGTISIIRKPVYFLWLIHIGYKALTIFDGKITDNMPYNERPEELAAFKAQSELCEKYIKYKLEKDNNDDSNELVVS